MKNVLPNNSLSREIDAINALAEKPDGVRVLEEYKNNMRFCRSWHGLCGTDCVFVSQYLEKLIESKKKVVSISDML